MTPDIPRRASTRVPPLWTLGQFGPWIILVSALFVLVVCVLVLSTNQSWWIAD